MGLNILLHQRQLGIDPFLHLPERDLVQVATQQVSPPVILGNHVFLQENVPQLPPGLTVQALQRLVPVIQQLYLPYTGSAFLSLPEQVNCFLNNTKKKPT